MVGPPFFYTLFLNAFPKISAKLAAINVFQTNYLLLTETDYHMSNSKVYIKFNKNYFPKQKTYSNIAIWE